MLLRTGAGFGALPLAHLLGKEGFGSEVSGVGQPEVSQAELLVSGNAADAPLLRCRKECDLLVHGRRAKPHRHI